MIKYFMPCFALLCLALPCLGLLIISAETLASMNISVAVKGNSNHSKYTSYLYSTVDEGNVS